MSQTAGAVGEERSRWDDFVEVRCEALAAAKAKDTCFLKSAMRPHSCAHGKDGEFEEVAVPSPSLQKNFLIATWHLSK